MVEPQHGFIHTNGVWLHTVTAGPENGPLIVFLHGFPEFWYGWRKQIPFFAQAGYRVLAPDQRGYNLSDKPRGLHAYRLAELAGDVIGLLDELGRERAVIVGHDWGGAVAWWLAKHAPERIERLVILNAPHFTAMSEDLAGNPRQWLRSAYIGYFQTPRLPDALLGGLNGAALAASLQASSRPGAFSAADLRAYRRAWAQPGALTAMLNWYRALLQRRPPLPDNPYISPQTLILWGARDPYLGRELARMSASLCNRGRLVLFRNATHWLQHEEPEQVNRMILSFIG